MSTLFSILGAGYVDMRFLEQGETKEDVKKKVCKNLEFGGRLFGYPTKISIRLRNK